MSEERPGSVLVTSLIVTLTAGMESWAEGAETGHFSGQIPKALLLYVISPGLYWNSTGWRESAAATACFIERDWLGEEDGRLLSHQGCRRGRWSHWEGSCLSSSTGRGPRAAGTDPRALPAPCTCLPGTVAFQGLLIHEE